MIQAASSRVAHTPEDKTAAFDSPAGQKAGQFYVSLRKYSSPDLWGSDSWTARTTFATGKTAMYMAYDRQPSRLDLAKVQKGKRVQLGPTVTLDQERCILCTRCVRFMREVAKQPQLGPTARAAGGDLSQPLGLSAVR